MKNGGWTSRACITNKFFIPYIPSTTRGPFIIDGCQGYAGAVPGSIAEGTTPDASHP